MDRQVLLKPQQGLTVSAALVGLTGELLPEWPRILASPAAPGEPGDVIAAGYGRVIGLASSFPGFHTPCGLGEVIDFPRLDQVQLDLQAAIVRIASG